jgi:hypothetical protein
MSDEKTKKSSDPAVEDQKADSRRKILKTLAAGSGVLAAGANLPEKWGRPTVTSIVLPAHAQTTPPEEPEPEPVFLMECSIEICEGTGGQEPCETFTTSGTTNIGCADNGVDIGGESGGTSWPNICTTVTEDGVGVPGLTVQLNISLNDLGFGGGGGSTASAVTDANGVACDFQFGGGNDLFDTTDGGSAEFCFSVLNRPEFGECCIEITIDCPE